MSRAAAVEAFPDREAMADAAADLIVARLAAPGPRTLVATGGSTPGPIYERLSRAALPWEAITVTLSDERWTAPDSPLSNERLVRDRLLVGGAAAARFVPLKDEGASPEADALAAERAIAALTPFAAVLLGMGEDGHVASLFPGAPADWLDPDGPRLVVGVAMSGLEPYVPRISLTVRALLQARLAVVAVTGEAKRTLIERVLAEPDSALPVRAILAQDRAPVRILWAP